MIVSENVSNTKIEYDIPLGNVPLNNSNFHLQPCDEIEVLELITNLKNRKSPDCDDISGVILKNIEKNL